MAIHGEQTLSRRPVRPVGFPALWVRHERYSRRFGDTVTTGNRCALVLGYTLKECFPPRPNRIEFSFHDLSVPWFRRGRDYAQLRETPFLRNFYVNASALAYRIKSEWGPPDIDLMHGFSRGDREWDNAAQIRWDKALTQLSSVTGVIFIEHAWTTHAGDWTVSHIDLWNGSQLGDYTGLSNQETSAIMKRAERIWLWRIR